MCLIVQKRPSIIFPNFSNCCWYCKRKYINILLVQLKVLTKGNCLDFDGANKSLNCQIYLLFSFFIVVSLEKYINSNPWRSFFSVYLSNRLSVVPSIFMCNILWLLFAAVWWFLRNFSVLCTFFVREVANDDRIVVFIFYKIYWLSFFIFFCSILKKRSPQNRYLKECVLLKYYRKFEVNFL